MRGDRKDDIARKGAKHALSGVEGAAKHKQMTNSKSEIRNKFK